MTSCKRVAKLLIKPVTTTSTSNKNGCPGIRVTPSFDLFHELTFIEIASSERSNNRLSLLPLLYQTTAVISTFPSVSGTLFCFKIHFQLRPSTLPDLCIISPDASGVQSLSLVFIQYPLDNYSHSSCSALT